MHKIDLVNIRNRGPSESHKNNKIMNDTIRSINDVIDSIQILVNDTDEKCDDILYNVRRRGYYNGTTNN